jgi:pimeloyl-ACP methyl ester carboxylesterase
LKLFPFVAASILASLSACGSHSTSEIAASNKMTVRETMGAGFSHMVLERWASPPGTELHVYIEGDGIPWVGNRSAADPTPVNTLALRLAVMDGNDVVYLGRPCYFNRADSDGCHPRYWTSDRYGEEVLQSMAAAITRIRQPRHTGIVLIGHSGGGVLAALLESRVDDVAGVISIGANLDIDAWTELHEYDQLTGSLNPIAQAKQDGIPHLQLVGGRDAKVPLKISRQYSELKSNVSLVVYPDFDHVCCWEKEWPAILAKFSGESILIQQ